VSRHETGLKRLRGFFLEGRFATLLDVINHCDSCFTLNLTEVERRDLVEYLKSLPD